MSKFKQKLIKGLSAFLLAGAFLFPKAQAQERIIIDNFSQPNDTTLNYYGSGDINKDNTITWEDAYRLDSLIKRTFTDPLDDRLIDRADITGDETIDNQDKQVLEDYLNETIPYLPTHWNKLDSLEKLNWFTKTEIIDKTDTISSTLCTDFTNAFVINYHGFPSLEDVNPDDFKYKISKNNRFNMPVYTVATRATGDHAHAIVGVLIGDNPFNFNHWYFFDPRFRTQAKPGDWNMINNGRVIIKYTWDMLENGGAYSSDIIKFDIDENGNPSLTYNKPGIVPSNPNKDTIPSEISLSIPDSSYFNSNVNLEYLVKENQTFLDSVYFDLNGSKTKIECSVPYYAVLAPVDSISGTIPLASEEGEYDLIFCAKDIAKPQSNETIKNIKFFIDKTSPEINIIYPENKDYIKSVDSMVISISDLYLNNDSCWYSTDNGQTKTYFTCESGEQKTIYPDFIDHENKWIVGASDKATNDSTAEVNFYISPDAVEEKKETTLEDYFKFYPNPVTGVGNFEFYLQTPQNLRFSISDITGRQLEQLVIEGNAGENKVPYDFSEHPAGIYIYRLEGLESNIKTGRVVKR